MSLGRPRISLCRHGEDDHVNRHRASIHHERGHHEHRWYVSILSFRVTSVGNEESQIETMKSIEDLADRLAQYDLIR